MLESQPKLACIQMQGSKLFETFRMLRTLGCGLDYLTMAAWLLGLGLALLARQYIILHNCVTTYLSTGLHMIYNTVLAFDLSTHYDVLCKLYIRT